MSPNMVRAFAGWVDSAVARSGNRAKALELVLPLVAFRGNLC